MIPTAVRLRGCNAHDSCVGDRHCGDLQTEVNQGVDSNLDGNSEADGRVNPVSVAAYDTGELFVQCFSSRLPQRVRPGSWDLW